MYFACVCLHVCVQSVCVHVRVRAGIVIKLGRGGDTERESEREINRMSEGTKDRKSYRERKRKLSLENREKCC